MTILLCAAVVLSIIMGGSACIGHQWRERVVRWMGAAVCVLLVVYAAGQFDWGEIMGKLSKSKAVRLTQMAESQMTAKDYDGAIATCKDLQPLDAATAHRLRGEALERKGRVDLAKVEYFASYTLGNETAGASLTRLAKKGGGK